jgi:hypothetical protein
MLLHVATQYITMTLRSKRASSTTGLLMMPRTSHYNIGGSHTVNMKLCISRRNFVSGRKTFLHPLVVVEGLYREYQ